MNKHYLQLTQDQRYQIWSLRETGMSLRNIAAIIGKDHSTVGRELNRNRGKNGYQPKEAEQRSQTRKRTCYKASKQSDAMTQRVTEKLRIGWSPESISERMKCESLSDSERLSHTSIYRLIGHDKAKGGVLHLYLPNTGKTRWKGGKRSKKAGVHLIPDRVDIKERPAVVDTRQRLGDWEGDTVHGQSAHLVTLVDRKSRFTLAKRVFSKTKQAVGDARV